MAIKAKVKGVDQASIALQGRLKRFINDKRTLALLGLTARDLIVGFLKTGKTMADGSKQRLDPLADSTVSKRKTLSRYNSTSEVFAPGRSNLSFTGQFLDAIQVTNVNKPEGTVTVEVTDTPRKAYTISRKGTREKNPPTNKELARHLADGGRQAIGNVDDQTRKRLRAVVVRSLRKKLREVQ